jgi:hypothetical protein
MVVIWLLGMVRRIALLDSREALRGLLDAGADRHAAWISTWPESTDGKKLLPRKGTSRKDSADHGDEADQEGLAARIAPFPGRPL